MTDQSALSGLDELLGIPQQQFQRDQSGARATGDGLLPGSQAGRPSSGAGIFNLAFAPDEMEDLRQYYTRITSDKESDRGSNRDRVGRGVERGGEVEERQKERQGVEEESREKEKRADELGGEERENEPPFIYPGYSIAPGSYAYYADEDELDREIERQREEIAREERESDKQRREVEEKLSSYMSDRSDANREDEEEEEAVLASDQGMCFEGAYLRCCAMSR